jgi:hypothetical protein
MKHKGPQKMGHGGPKPGGRPAGPCGPAQHRCASVLARFSLGHNSICFLSLPTLLATTKLGRVGFKLSFPEGVVLFLWEVSLGVVASFSSSCSS